MDKGQAAGAAAPAACCETVCPGLAAQLKPSLEPAYGPEMVFEKTIAVSAMSPPHSPILVSLKNIIQIGRKRQTQTAK